MSPPDDPGATGRLGEAQRLADVAHALGAVRDRDSAAGLLEAACRDLLGADRACCVWLDSPPAPDAALRGGIQEPPAAGLIAHLQPAAAAVCVAHAADAPHYDAERDAVLASGPERLLLLPVTRQAPRRVAAALVAVRAERRPAFTAGDALRLAYLAEHLAACLGRLALEGEIEQLSGVYGAPLRRALFREEAFARYAEPRLGELLQTRTRAPAWAYWTLAAAILVAVAAALLGTVDEVARGPAVLQAATARPASVLAFLPGRYRPWLAPGMRLQLTFSGNPQGPRRATIAAVSNIVGPAEARRRLAPALADSVNLTGPLVVVTALLDPSPARPGGDTSWLHDGMPATAAVVVASTPLAELLVPGLPRHPRGRFTPPP